MTSPIKLSPARLRVLLDVRDRKVYRSERGADLHAVYSTGSSQPVTRIARELVTAGLIQLGVKNRDTLTTSYALTEGGVVRLIELGLTEPAPPAS